MKIEKDIGNLMDAFHRFTFSIQAWIYLFGVSSAARGTDLPNRYLCSIPSMGVNKKLFQLPRQDEYHRDLLIASGRTQKNDAPDLSLYTFRASFMLLFRGYLVREIFTKSMVNQMIERRRRRKRRKRSTPSSNENDIFGGDVTNDDDDDEEDEVNDRDMKIFQIQIEQELFGNPFSVPILQSQEQHQGSSSSSSSMLFSENTSFCQEYSISEIRKSIEGKVNEAIKMEYEINSTNGNGGDPYSGDNNNNNNNNNSRRRVPAHLKFQHIRKFRVRLIPLLPQLARQELELSLSQSASNIRTKQQQQQDMQRGRRYMKKRNRKQVDGNDEYDDDDGNDVDHTDDDDEEDDVGERISPYTADEINILNSALIELGQMDQIRSAEIALASQGHHSWQTYSQSYVSRTAVPGAAQSSSSSSSKSTTTGGSSSIFTISKCDWNIIN